MALRENISSSKDWNKFFQEELKLSPEIAQGYSDEFVSQDITGSNILLGLTEPGFLNQFNISVGHQLELKAFFSSKKSFEQCNTAPPRNKVPLPVVKMNITQLDFDQFKFEWERYKEHYQITHNIATSLFFCCSDEVRQQIVSYKKQQSSPGQRNH